MGKPSPGGEEQGPNHELGSDCQLFRLSLHTKEATGPHASPGLATVFALWPQMRNTVVWFKHWLTLF